MSSLVGPRLFWIWETYNWRTTNFGFGSNSGVSASATYSNSVSNRLYGLLIGCSQEWYIGNGFACQLDADVVPDIDFVRTKAMYRRGGIQIGVAGMRDTADLFIGGRIGNGQGTSGLAGLPFAIDK